ncbi:putative quinol monooxygenase [Bradyrhizobium tropiciagri]|uniref:putative quinol monooxygenase n=1 Tax=Bradyrhizobium tropiciagri TaxID=312253 RepID=UPI002012675C|nr:antibiotic biosynthesis monooxygenase [Bradyrhizobium tropiciagri]
MPQAPAMPHAPGIPCVHIAEIEIDPTYRQAYMAALNDEIATALRVEPRVLVLHAVPDQVNPARFIVFEMYADVAAYQAHLTTPHFMRYKSATAHMVKSLKLTEAFPGAPEPKAL